MSSQAERRVLLDLKKLGYADPADAIRDVYLQYRPQILLLGASNVITTGALSNKWPDWKSAHVEPPLEMVVIEFKWITPDPGSAIGRIHATIPGIAHLAFECEQVTVFGMKRPDGPGGAHA
jgi:hypothetical protein